MAGKHPGSDAKLCGLSVMFTICILSAAGQGNLETDLQPSTAKLEDTVFMDMLTIVDNKFNALTSRITSLEAAVSGLQFYSVRHFRQISGSLQSTGNDLETVRKQVTQLEDDIRHQTSGVSLLAVEVSELKKSSADLLSEIESSAFYINENLDKQGQSIKTLLEDTVVKSARETTSQLSRQMEQMVQQYEKPKTEPVNCLVDFSGISEHIDLRFAEFKMQTHAHFVKLINAANFDLRRGKRFSDDKSETDESSKKDESEGDDSKTKGDDKSCDCKTELVTGRNVPTEDSVQSGIHDLGNRSDVIMKTAIVTPQTSSETPQYQDENDEQVMNALYNMTGSVLQAVNYFRNTGRLLEQIISNTDSLASQQIDLVRKFDLLQMGGHVTIGEDLSNEIPGADGQNPYKTSVPGAQVADKGCVLPTDVFNNVATIIKNGSQLLEVLTDLAQVSSVSLSRTTAVLQDEVTRVEGIRTQMATAMLARANGDESDPVSKLTNTTQRTVKLVEAIASNTGWLPQIFNNMQQLESLANRTLYSSMQNAVLLRMAQQHVSGQVLASNINQNENNPINSRSIPRAHGLGDRSHYGSMNVSLKDEATINRESLETIYSTSLQLNRIMPALTKLLSEPDPLITLAGGGKPDQGRVEIYHNGLWGALCHADLSHVEADLICRHLGFRGGISAGAGHFGPGAGITWTFNATCLATFQCAVVAYSEDTATCSHDLDTGVICDHMLRIISSDGSSKGKVGRLEIHHRGVWQSICGEGWSGYSARVACQQMGFSDGREMEAREWQAGVHSKWLNGVACTGHETRLDACYTDGWRDSCPGQVPAGVRCV